jgi:hypothetical protein
LRQSAKRSRSRGQNGVGLTLGDSEQRLLQTAHGGDHVIDAVAQVQAQVGRYLIVARTPGVQFLAGVADALDQACLDIHVYVFERRVPLEPVGIDLGFDFLEPLDDRLTLRCCQHADVGQHARMGDRAGDVVPVQTPVEIHRGRERLDKAVGGLRKTSAPGLF